MRVKISLLFLGLLIFQFKAQLPPNFSSSDILIHLQKLKTVGSVLYIAAHPDDENTRLLAYLAREKKVRTAYLSLTRGDGGQNLIGKEQGDALGLIRTQELLAARRVDGAEQFFTRANDFGYSKNPEETFSIWNKDSILADVVWTIRKFKPDVIICRFPTTGEGGHGHHTASAILAIDAFDAAADTSRFSSQLTFVKPWKAKRIFWNTFNFGGTNTTSPDQLKVDVGIYNAIIGKGYGEIASESRSMHKSQGFGSARGRGASLEYFKLLKGDSAKTDLFAGIDLTWNRFKTTKMLQKMIDECSKKFNPSSPEIIVNDLISIYKKIQDIDSKDADLLYWKQLKLKETEILIFACAGVWLEAPAADYIAIPGQSVNINTQFIKRNNCEVKLNKIRYWNQWDTTVNLILKTNELYTWKHIEKLNESTHYSNPYWLNSTHSPGIFSVNSQSLVGTPENATPLKVNFSIEINGLAFEIEKPLTYKFTDPVKGEVYRPLEILPPVTINILEKVYVFNEPAVKKIQFAIKSNVANFKGTVELNAPEGWQVQITNKELNITAKGEEIIVDAMVTPGKDSKSGIVKAWVKAGENIYAKAIKRIEYEHIPYQFILSNPEANLVVIDLKKAGNNIGYIPGAGDDVAVCLKQIGYNVTILSDELLTNEDLSKYNAIITGVRAYNTTERLQYHHNKLMSYVNNGGNLIVQYNTNNRIGPVMAKMGPYPFTISRDRVTDEKAEVKILKPEHPAFNFPNKISVVDFEGWIQERGIYFAGEKDKSYETLISMSDTNEKASEGSLIVTKYGKGNFVYTGLVFFRELPAGVPGAYRLLVNLLSLPQNK